MPGPRFNHPAPPGPCARTAALTIALTSLAACSGIGFGSIFNEFTTITVELRNETTLPVDPGIRYTDQDDDFDAFIANLFDTGDRLPTGNLAPGAVQYYDFDCDQLGLIYSDDAEQIRFIGEDYEADDSGLLQRGEDYDCGDLISFVFIGLGEDFEVRVSVNDRVVY